MEQLKLEQVDIGYGGQPLIQKIDLSFLQGKMTCILGSNGAGKTTLLKTIARIIKPLGGVIRFGGRCPADQRRPVCERGVRRAYGSDQPGKLHCLGCGCHGAQSPYGFFRIAGRGGSASCTGKPGRLRRMGVAEPAV